VECESIIRDGDDKGKGSCRYDGGLIGVTRFVFAGSSIFLLSGCDHGKQPDE